MPAPKINLVNQFGEVSFNPPSANAAFPQWGLVLVDDGAPVNGAEGTGAGYAEKGTILFRTDTGALYQNTNTKASPTWTALVVGAAPAQVLTGYTVGANTAVAATDTISQAIGKLQGQIDAL